LFKKKGFLTSLEKACLFEPTPQKGEGLVSCLQQAGVGSFTISFQWGGTFRDERKRSNIGGGAGIWPACDPGRATT